MKAVVMKTVNGQTNIDDYAKHLRTVNLTVLLLSVGLLVGRTLSIDSSLIKAHADLQIISDIVDRIDENWLYDYAKGIAGIDNAKHSGGLPASIFLDLPLRGATVFAQIDLPKDKWIVTSPKDCELFDYSNPNELATSKMWLYRLEHKIFDDRDSQLEAIRTKLSMQMRKPQSVLVFKSLWDFLNSPHYIYYARKLGDSGILHISYGGNDIEETHECKVQLENQKKQDLKGWKLLSELEEFHQEQESLEQNPLANEADYSCKLVVNEFTIRSERQGFLWGKREIKYADEKYRIEIPATCARKQIFPARELIFITGINKPEASFEIAFSELNEFVEKYPKLSFSSLESVLKELIDSGHEYFEIIGIKVPSIYLTYFGLGLMIVISSYYTIHLNQLAFLLTNYKWECPIAWIGIYHGVSAKAIMLVSTIVIPISVTVYLYRPGFFGHRFVDNHAAISAATQASFRAWAGVR